MEAQSIGQQDGDKSHDRAPTEDLVMDLFANLVVERSRESSGDDEVNLADLRIQVDDDLSRVELHLFRGGGDLLDDLLLELVSPVQSVQFDSEPMLVENH